MSKSATLISKNPPSLPFFHGKLSLYQEIYLTWLILQLYSDFLNPKTSIHHPNFTFPKSLHKKCKPCTHLILLPQGVTHTLKPNYSAGKASLLNYSSLLSSHGVATSSNFQTIIHHWLLNRQPSPPSHMNYEALTWCGRLDWSALTLGYD